MDSYLKKMQKAEELQNTTEKGRSIFPEKVKSLNFLFYNISASTL